MRKAICAVFAMLALGACTVTGPTGATVDDTFGYNPGQHAGINQAWVDLNGDGKPDAIFTGGKEQGSIEVDGSIPLSDGTLVPFKYSATDVKAFDGQGFRADLEAKIAQANADGNVELAEALTKSLDIVVNAAVAYATGGASEILD